MAWRLIREHRVPWLSECSLEHVKANLINKSTWEETWQTRNQEILINSKDKVKRRPKARLPQVAPRVNRDRVNKDRIGNRAVNRPGRAAASRALASANRARARVARVVKTSRAVKTSKVVASRVKVPGRVNKATKRTTIVSNCLTH